MTRGSWRGSSEYLKLLGYKRYHYRWWPHGSGRRFVLLHGRGESADIWTRFADRLAEEAEVIAVDLRGHGGTPWDPDRQYQFADFVEDLRLQLQHWAARCVLIGHGLGGHLALVAASEFPDLLDAIVLIEVDAEREPSETLIEQLAVLSAVDFESVPGSRFAAPIWRAVHNDLTWAQPGGGRRPKCDPAVLSPTAGPNTGSRMPTIQTPALVVRGRASFGVPPANARRLADALPNGTLVEVPGGTWPHVDSYLEVVEVVMAFVRKKSATQDRRGSV